MKKRKQTLIWAGLGSIVALSLLLSLMAFNHNTTPRPFIVGVVIANKDRLEKVNGLKAGMAELGLVENQQVVYQITRLSDDRDLAQNMVQLDALRSKKPDIIVAVGAWETEAAQKEFQDVPIVFAGIASPLDWGLVNPEDHPLLTGIDNGQIKLTGKRMEILTHLVPSVKKILVIADSQAPITKIALEEAQTAAYKLHLKMDTVSIATVEQLKSSIQSLKPGEYDAILPLPSLILEDAISGFMSQLTQKRILVMGSYSEQAAQGLQVAYGISFYEQGKQAANMTAKILGGTSVQSLRVELPNSIRLSVNHDALENIGITLTDQQASLVHEWVGRGR